MFTITNGRLIATDRRLNRDDFHAIAAQMQVAPGYIRQAGVREGEFILLPNGAHVRPPHGLPSKSKDGALFYSDTTNEVYLLDAYTMNKVFTVEVAQAIIT